MMFRRRINLILFFLSLNNESLSSCEEKVFLSILEFLSTSGDRNKLAVDQDWPDGFSDMQIFCSKEKSLLGAVFEEVENFSSKIFLKL